MKELERKLNDLLLASGEDKMTIESLQKDESIAPFSKVNRMMAYLLAMGKMTYKDYEDLYDEFTMRYQ